LFVCLFVCLFVFTICDKMLGRSLGTKLHYWSLYIPWSPDVDQYYDHLVLLISAAMTLLIIDITIPWASDSLNQCCCVTFMIWSSDPFDQWCCDTLIIWPLPFSKYSWLQLENGCGLLCCSLVPRSNGLATSASSNCVWL